VNEGDRAASQTDHLRGALDRARHELDSLPPVATDQAETFKAQPGVVATIAVPIDRVVVSALAEAPKVAFRDNAPDPVSAYMACLESLCNTCGGTWVDDDPNRAAGCYFTTNVAAAGYAVTVWSCIPGGFFGWLRG
jgi:hypothetical protein